MLAIALLPSGKPAAFEFGSPLEPERSPEAHLRWVLEDYPSRRDEQWTLPPAMGEAVLYRLLKEAGSEAGRLIPILEALGWYGMPDLAPPLVATLLAHPDPAVRSAAVVALGRTGNHAAAARLLPLLDEADAGIRALAAQALGKLGLESVLPALEAAAAKWPDLKPRLDRARRRVEAAGSADGRDFVETLMAGGDFEELLPYMVFFWKEVARVAADPWRGAEMRARAVRLLGLARVQRAWRAAAGPAGDEASPMELRRECVTALGRMRSRRAHDVLIPLLRSADSGLKESAIIALGRIGVARSLDPLLDCWDHADGRFRPVISLAVRRLCPITGAEAGHGHLKDMVPEPGKVLVILDGDALHRLQPPDTGPRGAMMDRVRGVLGSSEAAPRRDAAAVVALFGGDDDVAALSSLARTAGDAVIEGLAGWAAERLARGRGGP